jgi:hypothetical protein
MSTKHQFELAKEAGNLRRVRAMKGENLCRNWRRSEIASPAFYSLLGLRLWQRWSGLPAAIGASATPSQLSSSSTLAKPYCGCCLVGRTILPNSCDHQSFDRSWTRGDFTWAPRRVSLAVSMGSSISLLASFPHFRSCTRGMRRCRRAVLEPTLGYCKLLLSAADAA